jgi:myo-inositol 2-dehydrogenase / D-chiro-inositol 1-dehydrogenase
LRIGLIGCGGRGTGAAAQALAADPDSPTNPQLVAIADGFAATGWKPCLGRRSGAAAQGSRSVAGRIDVPQSTAASPASTDIIKVIEQSDVVLLTSPPISDPCTSKPRSTPANMCSLKNRWRSMPPAFVVSSTPATSA